VRVRQARPRVRQQREVDARDFAQDGERRLRQLFYCFGGGGADGR
jgi:hypothetical protein